LGHFNTFFFTKSINNGKQQSAGSNTRQR
jgi:hypothetical protein